jgi:hypothetical protein
MTILHQFRARARNFTHFVFVENSVSKHVFLHEIAHALLGHKPNYRIRKTREDRIKYVKQELEAEGNAIFWQYGKQSKQFQQFVKKTRSILDNDRLTKQSSYCKISLSP